MPSFYLSTNSIKISSLANFFSISTTEINIRVHLRFDFLCIFLVLIYFNISLGIILFHRFIWINIYFVTIFNWWHTVAHVDPLHNDHPHHMPYGDPVLPGVVLDRNRPKIVDKINFIIQYSINGKRMIFISSILILYHTRVTCSPFFGMVNSGLAGKHFSRAGNTFKGNVVGKITSK